MSDPYLLSSVQKHIAVQHVKKRTGWLTVRALFYIYIYRTVQYRAVVCCNIPWMASTLLSLYHHTVSLSSLHSVI